ncbi:hypothetical protein RHMOL_Rhmol07G0210300 [Rhododendron molle]|uniref:Uncharacterized protein n=1 Tax=Rhododendron molle TaxID=49168 RepID=A0ACC0N535_RHOML|nr:hypothetical protein RHMOL_Rhmol07G0210300 [Rhododendron molle]
MSSFPIHGAETYLAQSDHGVDRAVSLPQFSQRWVGRCLISCVLKVDVDELESVAKDWAVEAMPTFIFIKEGKLVDKVVGAQKEALQIAVAEHDTLVAIIATA